MRRIRIFFKSGFVLKCATFIATGFGIGYLPKAPGTWASVVALPTAYAISYLGGNLLLSLFIITGFIVGVFVSDIASNNMGEDDPSKIVIDEIIGQWLTLIFIPAEVMLYLFGFLLFRFFDIIKPWPISWLEKRYKGGFGIMIDDVFAAIFSGLILFLTLNILKIYAEA